MSRVVDLTNVIGRAGWNPCLETCRVVDCFGCFDSCYVCYGGGVGC